MPYNDPSLEATTTKHGLVPPLPGDNTKVLDGTGKWSTGGGGGGSGIPQGGPLSQDVAGAGFTISNSANRSLLSFGAVGDGRYVTGITTNGTTALVASSPAFSAGDVGKVVGVYGNGSGVVGQSTISAYTDSTHVTMAGTITAESNVFAVIGTGNAVAVKAAADWLVGVAGGASVLVPPGVFLIENAQQTGTVSGYNYTGQIVFAGVDETAAQMAVAKFYSDQDAGGLHIPSADVDTRQTTPQFLSLATSGYVFAVAPNAATTAALGFPSSWVMPVFENITIRTIQKSDGSGPGAVNAYWAMNAKVNGCKIDAVGLTGAPSPSVNTALDGLAVCLPGGTNWGIAECKGTKIMGYPRGVSFSDHAVLDVMVDTCGSSLAPGDPGGFGRSNTHGATILWAECQRGGGGYIIDPMGPMDITGKIIQENAGFAGLINNYSCGGDLQVEDSSPFGYQAGNGVVMARPNMFIRGTSNPVYASPSADLVDTSTKLSGGPFGTADTSNHVYFASNMTRDTTGMRMQSAGNGFAYSLQGPFYPSRNISFTFHTSVTAGRTWFGPISRTVTGGGTPPNGLSVIFSNNASGTGIYIYKGGTFTQIAHAAFSFAANTAYQCSLLTQQKAYDSTAVTMTVYINGTSALTYTLSTGEAGIYVPVSYDGFCGQVGPTVDDGGSHVSNITITRANDL